MPKRHPIKLLPSQDYLRECFDYDPETGALTWKSRPREHFATKEAWAVWNARSAGRPAGWSDKEGYRIVGLVSHFKAHRLIWKWMTGEEPPDDPDHSNRDRGDNRWDNLRPATRAQQMSNRGLFKNNTSGHSGIHRMRDGRYSARLRNRHLGYFPTAEEASAARQAAVMLESLSAHPRN
jgi:HNH endonuclease